MEQNNINIGDIDTSDVSELYLPPELWTIVVSFLDVRSLRLRRVCKLFFHGLKNIKNDDMTAVGDIFTNIEKRSKNKII